MVHHILGNRYAIACGPPIVTPMANHPGLAVATLCAADEGSDTGGEVAHGDATRLDGKSDRSRDDGDEVDEEMPPAADWLDCFPARMLHSTISWHHG